MATINISTAHRKNTIEHTEKEERESFSEGEDKERARGGKKGVQPPSILPA